MRSTARVSWDDRHGVVLSIGFAREVQLARRHHAHHHPSAAKIFLGDAKHVRVLHAVRAVDLYGVRDRISRPLLTLRKGVGTQVSRLERPRRAELVRTLEAHQRAFIERRRAERTNDAVYNV